MQVKHILAKKGKELVTVKPGASVHQASRLMAKYNIGAVVISDKGRQPDGIISERDIVKGVAKYGADYLRGKCGDACIHKVITCSPSDDIYRVMQAMNKRRMRHLPVVMNGVAIGMISLVDILREQMVKKEIM